MSGKIFPSSAWSRCVAVWALIFAYLWALFTLNFIRFSKKRNKQLHIFRSQCSVSACIFNGFLQFLLPLSVWKLANPRVPILRRGGAEGLFSLPSFQNLKHVPLFSFPTYSSLKSCPLAEAVQQVNDLIFKKYWGSDPLDYQIVSKDFWGKTGKKSDSTPQISLPGGRWSNLPPQISLPGGRWSNLTLQITLPGRSIPQFDPQDYILDQVDTLIWPPKLYPRPGQESKTGGIFHPTASSDQILSPKFESLAGWESKMEPIFHAQGIGQGKLPANALQLGILRNEAALISILLKAK